MRESKFEVATVIGAVVVLMTIGVLLFSGSQTSTILSKVGAAVGTGPNSEGSSSQDQPAPEGGAEAGSGVEAP